MATIKETILQRVEEVRQGLNSLKRSDYGNLYFYQEVAAWAAKQEEAEWKKLQDAKTGLLDSDDDMRALGEGPHIVASGKVLQVCASVSKPRSTFQLEAFIETLCKRFKLLPEKVVVIAEGSKAEGRAALSKRVVETIQ